MAPHQGRGQKKMIKFICFFEMLFPPFPPPPLPPPPRPKPTEVAGGQRGAPPSRCYSQHACSMCDIRWCARRNEQSTSRPNFSIHQLSMRRPNIGCPLLNGLAAPASSTHGIPQRPSALLLGDPLRFTRTTSASCNVRHVRPFFFLPFRRSRSSAPRQLQHAARRMSEEGVGLLPATSRSVITTNMQASPPIMCHQTPIPSSLLASSTNA